MAEQIALARAVIAVEGDATQLIASMASAEKAVSEFSSASKQSIATAVAALSGLGDEAANAFLSLSRSSQATVRNLAIETGRINAELGKISQQEFRTLETIVRGTSATISNQFVGALTNAKNALTEFKNAQQQAAAGTNFLDSLRAKIDALGKSQTDLLRIQSAGFGLDVAAQAKPLIDSLERYERIVNRIKEAERAAAADQSFINSLKAQDDALRQTIATFGKAQSEVLAYQAAQRGGAAAQNAAPIIASIRAQEQALKELQATEQNTASNNAFIAGLERRVQAINKTQAELLELELVQRRAAGLSAEDASRASQFIALLKEQERKQNGVNGALGEYDATARNARVSANQLRIAYAQLPAQITDVVTSLASGIPAYLVLIQQGGQIKDAFGGIGNAAKALTSLLTPLRVAVGGAAAVFGTLAVAYFQGSKEADEFRKAIVLSGNAIGTNVGQLATLAGAVGQVVGTQSQAAAVIAQIAASGKISVSAIAQVTEAAIRLERIGGPAVDKTVEQFAKLADEPTKAALKLNESTNFLTLELYRQIKALEDAGRTAEAATIAQQGYAQTVIQRTKELEGQLGTLERAWMSLGDVAKAAWDKLLNVGREQTLQERLEEARRQIQQIIDQSGQQGVIEAAAGGNTQAATVDQERLNAAIAIRDQLAEQVRLINRGSSALQDQRNQFSSIVAAETAWAEIVKKNLTDEERLRAEIEAIRQAGIKSGQSEAQIQEQIAKARERLSKKEKEDPRQKAYEQLIKTLGTDLANATAELTGLQQNLTASQIEYEKIIRSPYYEQFYEGEKEALRNRFNAVDAINAQIQAEKARKKAIEDSSKANKKIIEDESKRLDKLLESNDALRQEIDAIGKTKQATAELEAARLLNNAAAAEGFAIVQETLGASKEEVAILRQQAAALRERANLVVQRAGAEGAEEARKANEKAAKDAFNTWRETIDDISRALADGIIDGGKSAARALQDLFNRLVLRPIIQAALTPLVQGVASAFGFVNPAAAASGGGNAAQTAMNLASTASTLNTALTAFSGGIASSLGNAAVIAGNAFGSTALTQFGTGLQGATLAPGLAGPTTAGASGAIGAGAATAPFITAAAGIAAGVLAGRAISGGFGAFGSQSGNRAVNIGTIAGAFIAGPIGAAIGGIIGGIANRAFGRRAPQVESRELVGTFQEGQFAGNVVTNLLAKGGLFRSDKRTQLIDAVTGDFDKALDEAGTEIIAIVRKYGEALALPVEDLAKIPAEVRVKLTGDVEEDRKALETALEQYTDTLFDTYAAALEPLRLADEEIPQTIERVGGALLGVNSVLEQIGIQALKLNVSGGKTAVALTELFGGVDGFTSASARYYERFFSDAEKLQQSSGTLGKVFEQLNITIPTTKEQFRQLVETAGKAENLEANPKVFAALLLVSELFDDIRAAAEKAAIGLRDALEAFRERFRTPAQSQRASISRIATQLIDQGALKGTVEEITNLLANASKESIFAAVEGFIELSDASDETKTSIVLLINDLLDLRDGFNGFAEDVTQFLAELKFSDISPLSYKEQLDAAKDLFETTLEGARKGDPTAMRNLLNNARGYLDEARDYYASGDAYVSIFNQVTRALSALGVQTGPAEVAQQAASDISRVADAVVPADGAGANQTDPAVDATREQTQTIDNFSDNVIDSSAAEVEQLILVRDTLDRKFTENTAAVLMQVDMIRADIADRKFQQELQAEQIRLQAAESRITAARVASIDDTLRQLLTNAQLSSAAPTIGRVAIA